MLTLAGLRKALEPVLSLDVQKEAMGKLRKLNTQLRGMEARIRDAEPRTVSLSDMVGRIEQAYEAADQLPADLESLSEARQKIVELERAATKDHVLIDALRDNAEKQGERLKAAAREADSVLQRCETAYSAATSVGLAAAFTERSGALSKSMWAWVAGLVVSLAIGGCIGASVHREYMIFRI